MREKEELRESTRKIIFLATIFMLLIYVIAAVINTTIIFADGSGVCVSMLSKKSWYLYDEMRNFGLAIRQMFAMAYLKLVDMPKALVFVKLLAFGYAFWTSFFYMLAVVVCVKRKQDILLYFTVALISFHYVFSGFNLVLESSMATSAFWFLFILFQNKVEEINLKWKVLSILTLFLLSKVYASMVFFSIVLAIIILKNVGIRGIVKCKYWLVCLCLLIYDEFLSVYYILFTPNSDARDGLIKTLTMINRDFFCFFLFWVGIVLIIMYLTNKTMFFWNVDAHEKANEEKNVKLVMFNKVVQIVFGVLFVGMAICKSSKYASLNFASRSLNFLVPIAIVCIVLYLEWGSFLFNLRYALVSLITLELAGTISIIVATTGYKDYLTSLGQITSHQEGFVDCSQYDVQATGYMTTFTMPQESILSQLVYRNGGGLISSILVQPKDWIAWELFDSYDINMYPDLSEYNIFYDIEKFQ